MTFVRIPVSLKLETDTDIEFHDFVQDLKETRTLSTFIMQLLYTYHENNSMQSIADASPPIFNPMAEIQENIDRIQQNHRMSTMSTKMLSHHMESTLNVAKEVGGLGVPETHLPSSPAPVMHLPSPEMQQVEKRMDKLESYLPSLESKIDLLLSAMSTNGVTQSPSLQPTEQAVSLVSEPVPVEPQVVQPVAPLVEAEPVANPAPFVFQPPVTPPHQSTPQPVSQDVPAETGYVFEPKPAVAPVVTVAPVVEQVSDSPVLEFNPTQEPQVNPFLAPKVESEEDTKKPASFNKAFGSLKKKS